MKEMEQNMKAMERKLTELQQDQGNQTFGPKDLANYMEASHSNLIDKLARDSGGRAEPDSGREYDQTLVLPGDKHITRTP